jgi:hypothetical protein
MNGAQACESYLSRDEKAIIGQILSSWYSWYFGVNIPVSGTQDTRDAVMFSLGLSSSQPVFFSINYKSVPS